MSNVIPFGEWLPDLPPYGLQGATVCSNVLPDAVSYRPFPSLVAFSNSISATCIGGVFATDSALNNYNYVGDATGLYLLTQNSFSVATRLAGGAYTTFSDDFWEFANWGNTVIAVNGFTDIPQRISLGATNFTDMTVGVKAKHITVMRDFVVMGNVSDSAANSCRVRWSAFNNPTDMVPSAATLSDYQDLPTEGGPVQRLVGGEYGVVFQQRSIWRMTFVGSPEIFRFDKVHNKIGAVAPQGVVNYQNLVFFLAADGFYTFDGSQLEPIGRGKVDQFFATDLHPNYTQKVVAAIDPINKYVMWAYPSPNSTAGKCDKIIVYSWAYKRWSLVTGLNIEYLLSNITTGYTLEGLDAISTNLDLLAIPLDSSQWTGGKTILGAFNSSHVLGRFNGSAMAATVTTGEFQMFPDNRAMLTEIRPVVIGVSTLPTITVLNRNNLTESVSTGSVAAPPNVTGFVQVRCSARYHKIQLDTTGEYTQLMGVEVSGVQGGVR